MLSALELPLVDMVRHYLSLLVMLCQKQSCWSMWRTLGRCHRRCQIWTHLQDKHKLMLTCCIQPACISLNLIHSDVFKVSGGELKSAHSQLAINEMTKDRVSPTLSFSAVS